MAYRFPLAAVLEVRKVALGREEQTLARIHAEIKKLRSAITANAEELRSLLAALEKSLLKAPLAAMHLHALQSSARYMRDRDDKLREQLRQFEQLRAQQTERYQQAYRDHELMVTLRDEDRERWRAQQARAEQQLAEQAYLARFCRERAE